MGAQGKRRGWVTWSRRILVLVLTLLVLALLGAWLTLRASLPQLEGKRTSPLLSRQDDLLGRGKRRHFIFRGRNEQHATTRVASGARVGLGQLVDQGRVIGCRRYRKVKPSLILHAGRFRRNDPRTGIGGAARVVSVEQ